MIPILQHVSHGPNAIIMLRLQLIVPVASKQTTPTENTPTQNQSPQISQEKTPVFPTEMFEQAHMPGCPILLSAGLDTTSYIDVGVTALRYAAFQGDTMLVSYLLQSGVDPNNVAEAGSRHTALETAVSRGSFDIVRLLCQAGAELNGQRSGILQKAAQRGDTKMVRLLLDYGAEIGHVPSQHDLSWLKPISTALHEACISRSKAVVLLLIERGADPEAKDWAGKTALERAKEIGEEANDIVIILRNHLVSKIIRRCDW